jgi:hypothetical protein
MNHVVTLKCSCGATNEADCHPDCGLQIEKKHAWAICWACRKVVRV